MVWEPLVNFLVFEAWFTNAQSRLSGDTNVYQMRLYVAHSQSFQLYQMTYVEWEKFDEDKDDGSKIYLYTMAFSEYYRLCKINMRVEDNVESDAMLDP